MKASEVKSRIDALPEFRAGLDKIRDTFGPDVKMVYVRFESDGAELKTKAMTEWEKEYGRGN